MLKVNSYSNKGIKLAGTVTLPTLWEAKMNRALLAQAIRVYGDRAHIGEAYTKGRGEINRTTKKWYKQKGTGGARHGARSAPIFVGGGVAHGPKGVSRTLTLPTTMKRKATAIAMTQAVKEERVMAGELNFKKTNEAQKFIDKVITRKNPKVTFVMSAENADTKRYLRNIENVRVLNFLDLNVFDIFFGGSIVLDGSIFKAVKKAVAKEAPVAKKVAVKKAPAKTVKKIVKKGTTK